MNYSKRYQKEEKMVTSIIAGIVGFGCIYIVLYLTIMVLIAIGLYRIVTGQPIW